MIQLKKFSYTVIASTNLVFPENDCGFKGSAWHGRIDHAIQKNPALKKLLKREAGLASLYWISAPIDFKNDATGPFSREPYAAGLQFEIAITVVGAEAVNLPHLSTLLAQAISYAGAYDTAGFFGKFSITASSEANFPLSQLQVPTPSAQSQNQLQFQFHTMLRLGEGGHMRAAQQALTAGQIAVPRLQTLVDRQIQRAHTLPVSDAPTFNTWLQTLQALAIDTEAHTSVVAASVAPFDVSRLSAKIRATQPIGGLLGTFTFAGPAPAFAELLPLFKLGEWLRIGRKTGLGLGQFSVSLHQQ